jgi:hypothetical protein
MSIAFYCRGIGPVSNACFRLSRSFARLSLRFFSCASTNRQRLEVEPINFSVKA